MAVGWWILLGRGKVLVSTKVDFVDTKQPCRNISGYEQLPGTTISKMHDFSVHKQLFHGHYPPVSTCWWTQLVGNDGAERTDHGITGPLKPAGSGKS
ncbi:hypothetical protein [Salibacterium qingdaonense]|nr:hypothetical protein [Salibacterium qingdaonense]